MVRRSSGGFWNVPEGTLHRWLSRFILCLRTLRPCSRSCVSFAENASPPGSRCARQIDLPMENTQPENFPIKVETGRNVFSWAPKVSVVIPAYNVAEFIGDTLDS